MNYRLSPKGVLLFLSDRSFIILLLHSSHCGGGRRTYLPVYFVHMLVIGEHLPTPSIAVRGKRRVIIQVRQALASRFSQFFSVFVFY